MRRLHRNHVALFVAGQSFYGQSTMQTTWRPQKVTSKADALSFASSSSCPVMRDALMTMLRCWQPQCRLRSKRTVQW